uniref:DUF72 domain-containing protein n=1 Tax=Thermofilum pendens TaxID=2269 RepID=A0A7C4B8P0_THEPE
MDKTVLYIGCCGWCMGRSRYYAVFNVVELQDTFYDPPDPERLGRLASEAPEGFAFAMKAWQAVTHPLDSPTWKRAKKKPESSLADRYGFLRPTREVLEAWDLVARAARALRASVVVVQTPPSFGYSEENLRNAVEFFRSAETRDFWVGWEPRGSWLESPGRIAEVVSRFDRVVHVVDPFRARPVVEREVVYYRLHGIGGGEVNYRYKYTDEDLRRLAELVRPHLEARRAVYVLFNNVYMAQDAARFKELAAGM